MKSDSMTGDNQVLRIAAIGGGTGLPTLLSGLCRFADLCSKRVEISAIVSVADDGGSSGILRRSLNIPAVGDLRNCIAALNPYWDRLFQHRFSSGDGLKGHALGNLILAALHQQSGNLAGAVEEACELLQPKGRVLPITEQLVTLCAQLENGSIVRGETEIPRAAGNIQKIWLEPSQPPPSPGVLRTIVSADVIVFGPGSLFTSVIPNLLVDQVAKWIRISPALKIFVCNLMTQPGETGLFTANDHVRALQAYLGKSTVDLCVINSAPIQLDRAESYFAAGARPVVWNESELEEMGVVPVAGDLLPEEHFTNRHDPIKLARLILFLARETVTWQFGLDGQSSWVA